MNITASPSRSTRWPRPVIRARANSVVCSRPPCTRRRSISCCTTASRRASRSCAAATSPSPRSRAASASAARAIIPRSSASSCSVPPPNTAKIIPPSSPPCSAAAAPAVKPYIGSAQQRIAAITQRIAEKNAADRRLSRAPARLFHPCVKKYASPYSIPSSLLCPCSSSRRSISLSP